MAGRNVDLAQPGRRMDRIGSRAGRMETARRARRQKKNGEGKIGALLALARSLSASWLSQR